MKPTCSRTRGIHNTVRNWWTAASSRPRDQFSQSDVRSATPVSSAPPRTKKAVRAATREDSQRSWSRDSGVMVGPVGEEQMEETVCLQEAPPFVCSQEEGRLGVDLCAERVGR